MPHSTATSWSGTTASKGNGILLILLHPRYPSPSTVSCENHLDQFCQSMPQPCPHHYWWYTYPPDKSWTSSVGMMTFPIWWKVIKFKFQTTNQISSFQKANSQHRTQHTTGLPVLAQPQSKTPPYSGILQPIVLDGIKNDQTWNNNGRGFRGFPPPRPWNMLEPPPTMLQVSRVFIECLPHLTTSYLD